ncbi:MAG: hypothetical protein JWQ54_2569 [Mucilaginibacter sp.]|nr:hypothetical protein [Mucilaginibacter sp.]
MVTAKSYVQVFVIEKPSKKVFKFYHYNILMMIPLGGLFIPQSI